MEVKDRPHPGKMVQQHLHYLILVSHNYTDAVATEHHGSVEVIGEHMSACILLAQEGRYSIVMISLKITGRLKCS